MGGAWWKLSGGYGRCEDVRVGRCVQSGFVLPHGRVCFGQGESPVKLFGKLFGKSAREDSGNATARHRAQPGRGGRASARCSGTRSAARAVTFPAARARRLLTLPVRRHRFRGTVNLKCGWRVFRPVCVPCPAGQPRRRIRMSAWCVRGAGTATRRTAASAPTAVRRCGPGAAGACLGDHLHDLHLRARGLRLRGHRPDADAVALARRPRPPSRRCRWAPRCWWCAAGRTRAAASCWTAI